MSYNCICFGKNFFSVCYEVPVLERFIPESNTYSFWVQFIYQNTNQSGFLNLLYEEKNIVKFVV